MSENLPEWLTVGAKVAVYREGRGATGRPHYRTARVDRLTPTQAVVAGARYRLADLKEMGGSYYDANLLVALTDPRIAAVDAADRLSSLRSEALRAVDAWRIGAGGTPELARAAAAALIAYADGTEPKP